MRKVCPSAQRRSPPAAPTAERIEHGGVRVTIPTMKLVSEANEPGHSIAKARRTAAQRSSTSATLRVMAGAAPAPPCRIVITRVFPYQLDSDNLTGSAKHVRDGVADWLGLDDRDPRLEWHVAQEKGVAAVRIEILPVVAWSTAAVSSRVALEGTLSAVDLTLDAGTLRGLAERLDEMATGTRATTTLRVGATRLRIHLHTPASKEPP